ncbi:hypothetical protein ARMGADRAFT_1079120 [Armillaria gallica]|uniref:PWWP domain-containing protein n=1 Tax=Armillaria gallica TaxID=47427 RepID=A0A2H3DK40_ARMGA|nr:hypothetical protein ARMGADRAFT_1079120 [Armillaria gallica]
MSKKAAKEPKTSGSANIYDHRDIVLGKVCDYPLWPGMSTPTMHRSKSLTTDIQAKKQTSTLCDFSLPAILSWLGCKNIFKLQQHEIEAYINDPFKQSYPSEWEKCKAEQAEAANEEKPKKRKRDSEGGISARKRKTSTTGDAKKETPPKGKQGGKKKQNVESKDDDEADEDVSAGKKGTSLPPTKNAKRDKEEHNEGDVANNPEAPKVREWRHKFPKTFLSNKGNPKEEDMPQMDKLFRAVEAYQSITIHYIMFSEIGQFVCHIAALTEEKIPKR